MSRIFLSHSSTDNGSAVALREWLALQGWDDVFLDLDPRRGIAAGERWERALNQAALRCEAVLFLVSKAWLYSDWCLKEFNLAHRLNKRLVNKELEMRVSQLYDLSVAFEAITFESKDHVEAVQSFLEKRPAVFRSGKFGGT